MPRSFRIWDRHHGPITLALSSLRDTERIAHPTYVEFEIQGMVENNLYPDFAVLFRLLHRSRLPKTGADASDSLIERYYLDGVAEGGRVRERLAGGSAPHGSSSPPTEMSSSTSGQWIPTPRPISSHFWRSMVVACARRGNQSTEMAISRPCVGWERNADTRFER
jgi:hypothetical protein